MEALHRSVQRRRLRVAVALCLGVTDDHRIAADGPAPADLPTPTGPLSRDRPRPPGPLTKTYLAPRRAHPRCRHRRRQRPGLATRVAPQTQARRPCGAGHARRGAAPQPEGASTRPPLARLRPAVGARPHKRDRQGVTRAGGRRGSTARRARNRARRDGGHGGGSGRGRRWGGHRPRRPPSAARQPRSARGARQPTRRCRTHWATGPPGAACGRRLARGSCRQVPWSLWKPSWRGVAGAARRLEVARTPRQRRRGVGWCRRGRVRRNDICFAARDATERARGARGLRARKVSDADTHRIHGVWESPGRR